MINIQQCLKKMTKNNLKRIIQCAEIPKIVTVFSSWDVCGRNLVFCLLKSHLLCAKKIVYLCYSIDSSYVFNQFQCNDNVKTIDLFSDPCGWKDKQNKLFKLEEIIEENLNDNTIIVIDDISIPGSVIPYSSLIRCLNKWITSSENVAQIIVNCFQDITDANLISSLEYVSHCHLVLKPTTPLSCNLLIKKKSGKIINCTEEYEVDTNYNLKFAREIQSKTSLENITNEDPLIESTFELSLTDDQKKTRSNVVLPHTRIQTEGQIHYIPETEDDWDDEDPDCDLEI